MIDMKCDVIDRDINAYLAELDNDSAWNELVNSQSSIAMEMLLSDKDAFAEAVAGMPTQLMDLLFERFSEARGIEVTSLESYRSKSEKAGRVHYLLEAILKQVLSCRASAIGIDRAEKIRRVYIDGAI